MSKIENFFWDFYRKWNGNPVDTDGYGAQCVSLFKKYLEALGDPNWRRALGGDGYAHQIAYRFKELGYDKYFDWITGNAQIGDVLVYKVYPGATPYSHVSFFLGDTDPNNHYSWGQNQGTWNMASNTIILPNAALIAVLRPKGFKENVSGFDDVPDGCYFTEAIREAKEKGFINGSNGDFKPYDSIKRGDLCTILHRLKGSPKVNQINPFTDVASNDYYYMPIMWATLMGITAGTGKNFRPKDTATRAEAIAFLYRLCGSPKQEDVKLTFKDVPEDAYYRKPVEWGVRNCIINGKTADKFDPNAECSRADFVVMLMRTYYRKK